MAGVTFHAIKFQSAGDFFKDSSVFISLRFISKSFEATGGHCTIDSSNAEDMQQKNLTIRRAKTTATRPSLLNGCRVMLIQCMAPGTGRQ